MTAKKQQALAVFIGAVFAVAGCSDDGVRYAPVEGTVTVDGNPIAKAQVVLSCENVLVDGPKPTSRGTTDDSGHFVLRSLTPDKRMVDGAVVGDHHVFVTTEILGQDSHGQTIVIREELLGKAYTNGEKLTLTVPEGGDRDVRLELTAK